MRSLWQDVRLGIRGLLKSPGFTIIAVLTVGLGIGANTAIFTVLNAVLLRALPAEDPQRLVMLSNPEFHGIGVGDGSGKRGMFAYCEFRDSLDKNQVFSGMLAVDSYVRRTDITVEGARSSEPEHADVTMVSGDYFRVLGIRPFLGRTFRAEVDKVQHANPVAVISYGYWKSRFALDLQSLGKRFAFAARRLTSSAWHKKVSPARRSDSHQTSGFRSRCRPKSFRPGPTSSTDPRIRCRKFCGCKSLLA